MAYSDRDAHNQTASAEAAGDLLGALDLPIAVFDSALRVVQTSPAMDAAVFEKDTFREDATLPPTTAQTSLINLVLENADLLGALRDTQHHRTAHDLDITIDTRIDPSRHHGRHPSRHHSRHYQARVRPYRERSVVLTLIDVTERRRQKSMLRDSEAKYRLLFNSIDVVFTLSEIITDSSGAAVDYRILEANPAFETVFDIPVADVIGRTARELVPDLEALWIDTYASVIATNTPVRVVERVASMDRWFDVFAFPFDGPILAVLCRDVTKKKMAETALYESEQKLLRLFQQAPAAIAIHEGAEHTYAFANQMYCHIVGDRPLLGLPMRRAIPDLLNGMLERYDYAYTTGEPVHESEFEIVAEHGGASTYFSQVLQPWFDADGTVAGVMSFTFEITEQVETRQALQQFQETLEKKVATRTEQVRNLAARLSLAEQFERARIARVVHDDVQQLLHALQLRCKLVAKNADAPVVTKHITEAEEILRQVVGVVRNLMVEINPPVLRDEGLTEAFRWLATHMRRQHHFTVTLNLVTDTPAALDDNRRVMLFHSVRELLFNAVKHANVDTAELCAEVRDGQFVIKIRDEGVGFDLTEAITRKRQSFGLATIRERLELNGGTFEVTSAPGQGTNIVMTLPLGAD